MSEMISDPRYWKRRLRDAPHDNLHHSIFKCPKDKWERIEDKHREILTNYVKDDESVLDVGCAYGRLLNLLPKTWSGDYLGIDICPEFIRRAQEFHPKHSHQFQHINILRVEPLDDMFRYDWAVFISIRPMIKRHCGDDGWLEIQSHVTHLAHKLLFLEYDETDEGEVL